MGLVSHCTQFMINSFSIIFFHDAPLFPFNSEFQRGNFYKSIMIV